MMQPTLINYWTVNNREVKQAYFTKFCAIYKDKIYSFFVYGYINNKKYSSQNSMSAFMSSSCRSH